MGIPPEKTVTGILQGKTVMEILQKSVTGIPQDDGDSPGGDSDGDSPGEDRDGDSPDDGDSPGEHCDGDSPDGDSPEDGNGVYPREDCDGDSPKQSSLEEKRDELRRHSRRGISVSGLYDR